MKSIDEYIKSGILEMYVLGTASDDQNKEVEMMSAAHLEIRNEIDTISEALLLYAEKNAPAMNPTVKPMIMAVVDYSERIKNGEQPAAPLILNEKSQISDYSLWLDREDMKLPDNFNDIHVKIIGHVPNAMTAIVWINDATPYEVHDHEYEKFLIVEGTCDISIEDKKISLVPGDYLSIPLHLGHVVKVTSEIPCKVILQRVAA